ncbi:MAG TPA: YqeG family HAD IIIA-type phosphatase [Syntrophomonas sp.]|nr:YqeG family HAD IIIA-type phosphatase [Syntrophomonas sp.]HRW12349.1 YqeG family HAD IIIA-type phosphatase [Syntrophomonas sp.]
MTNKLYPRMYVDTLLDVPLEELAALGVRAFILDLDNTITEWNSQELRAEVEAWFRTIRERGFKACILSNNGEQRIVQIAARLEIPFIHRARKPMRGAFLQAVEIMGMQPDAVAVIGDQIFTDILGGNRAGLYTILVKPLARREFYGTKISRAMEFFVLRRYRRRSKLANNGRPGL